MHCKVILSYKTDARKKRKNWPVVSAREIFFVIENLPAVIKDKSEMKGKDLEYGFHQHSVSVYIKKDQM